MKVLFIAPPWSDVYGSYKSAAKTGNGYPPLGLCYLSAVLEKEGYITKIIDSEMENKTIHDVIKEVGRFRPEIIGITAATPIFYIVKNLAAELKKMFPSIPIFMGGPHCTVVLDRCLSECRDIDYCLYGECERSILDFMQFFKEKTKPRDVQGLIYRNDQEQIKVNRPPDLIDDLDSIPFPARDKLDLDRYKWSVPGKGLVKFTPIITSRGCPFKCIFCSAHTIFGKKVRNRSIARVLDEIQFLVEKDDIKHYAFIDDTLTLNHERVKELCRGIKERKLDITWEGWTRANTVNYDILKMMKNAGFVRISFGLESANARISEIAKKEIPLDAYVRAYPIAKKLGIETRASVMLGLPGETYETAMETLNFTRTLKGCDQAYINIATPYPATELYDMAKAERHGMRLLTDDFAEYRRYGGAVIEVNDLRREDLVKLQRKGFLMFYFTPARIWYNFKRAGLLAFIKNAVAFARSIIFSKEKY
ncbi:MAG: radical SAM protein [Candidatus Omnitrophica bacterium]|nr:radical SAM protein [Candidatus Omnitrophota bacterium]